MQSSLLYPRTCLGVFLSIRFRHQKRCKTGAFRHPNALLPGSETLVDFFATNACNHIDCALECTRVSILAFVSCTNSDAKRVHFGTRMHYCRVSKLCWIFSQRTFPTRRSSDLNMFGSVFEHSVPAPKTMQNGCISAPECTIAG